jgi:PPM family protein phosphatase
VATIVGRTNVGARDGQNQDAMGWDEPRQLALVADGMGGYVSGEIASGLVKQTILEAAEPVDLDAAILQAHARILAAVEENPEHARMGSTVVAMRIANRSCDIAWVGDSRGYLWRRGALSPLTRDHSVAEVLRDAENLSETQLRVHPLRNKVTQSLGIEQPVPSHGQTPLRRGDWVLLCSDGLTGELRDDEISTVLTTHRSLDGAADALINEALAKGGHDNVTVVLVEYTGLSKFDFSGWRNERTVIWLSVAGGVLLAMAVASIAWLIKSWI